MMEHVDIYCERLAPGLIAEPLNAISNISFFFAAFGVFILSKKQCVVSSNSTYLFSLLIAIGIGSSLFHTFATRWAEVADVTPILLFQISFIWMYLRQITRLKYWQSFLLLIIFILSSKVSDNFSELLNGSLSYTPAFIASLSLGVYHLTNKKNEPYILLIAAIIFLISLYFRTIDQSICQYFLFGTHFIWHCLNGIVLYFLARSFILNCSPNISEKYSNPK